MSYPLPSDVHLCETDFDTATGTLYPNKVLKTMRYRINLDNYFQLTEGDDFNYLPDGGFELLNISMIPDGRLILQFY